MLKKICVSLLVCFLTLQGQPASGASSAPAEAAPPSPGSDGIPSRPLTLNELINLGVQRSPAVKAAESQIKALESRSGEIRSTYLPEFRAQYWYNTNPIFGEVNNGFSSIQQHTDVGLRFPLLKQFGLKPGEVKKAKLEIQVAQQELLRAVQTAAWQIRELYFDLWGSEQLKHAYQKLAGLIEEARQLATVGARQKELLPADLLTIEQQLTEARQRAELAAKAQENRKILLARILGLPPASLRLAPYIQGSRKLPPFTELLDVAKKARPDLAVSELQAQRSRVDAAYAPFNFLDFHADAYYNVDRYKILGTRTGALLGVHFSGPLAIFSLSRHRRQQSERQAEAWIEKGQSTAQSIEQELLLALEKYQDIEARRKMAADRIKIAEEHIRAKEILVREPSLASSASSLDLILARCQLSAVHSELVSLQSEQFKAYYYLMHIMGTDELQEGPPIRNSRQTDSKAIPLAFWVYQTAQLLDDPKLEALLLDLKQKNVRRLFFSIDGRIFQTLQTRPAAVQTFITAARRQGLAVEALLDEPTWLLPANRTGLQAYVRAIHTYNLQAPPEARFQALHLDLEINQLPNWQNRQEEAARYLRETIQAVRALGTGLPIVVDLPIWLHRHGVKGWQDIILAADSIVFMAYEQKTPQQLLNSFQPELLFCQQHQKPVWIGLHLSDFTGKGNAYLMNYMQQVEKGINMQMEGFALFQLAYLHKLE